MNDDRLERFKKLSRMKIARRAIPKNKNEVKILTDFHHRVKNSKQIIHSGGSIGDSREDKVAKVSNKAHKLHGVFNKALDDFKSKEKHTYQDLRDVINRGKAIAEKANKLTEVLDGKNNN